jgi:hypothetical protein
MGAGTVCAFPRDDVPGIHALPRALGQLLAAGHSGLTCHEPAPRGTEPYGLAYLVPARSASDLSSLVAVQYGLEPLRLDDEDTVLAANGEPAAAVEQQRERRL